MSSQLSLSDFFESDEPETPQNAPEISPSPVSLQFGPDLSPQQLRVRNNGVGNQVVVAGAGTGKTETLTQRILKLLVEGDGQSGPVELSQVVALTFTDKGAAEMRGRVYERLVQLGRSAPPGELKARLGNLRANFAEENRILTFDAFSFRILSQFPRHCPLDGDREILDGSTRAEMKRDITRQFWNRVEASFSDAQKLELWELFDAFSSRRAALDWMAILAEDETAADLQELAQMPERAAWSEKFAVLVARDGERLWEIAQNEVEKLGLPPELNLELNSAERILMGGKGGILTDKGWAAPFKKRWSPELLLGMGRVERRLMAWRAEARIERDDLRDWKSRRAVAFLCANALWWQGAAREWCAARGVASFAEIAQAALEMVGESEVAGPLKSGISHLLIDEFQDTNWRQWRLLDALRDEKTGNVLIVGDEKQAIFRFRGGDITVFEGVREILLGKSAHADELTVSRRSTTQLVEWTNTVFRQVLPSEIERQKFEAPFQALQSETAAPGNGLWQMDPAQWHLEAENAVFDSQKTPVAIVRERAARALARFLRALCDDAKKLAAQPETVDLQFPDLANIAAHIAGGENAIGIIFESHAVKTLFENQLRAFDVPFVSVRGTGFWNSEPVTLSLHLLQLLLDASDRIAFVGLARSALGGVSDVGILEWHLALQGDVERMDGADCAQIAGFAPSRENDARALEILAARLLSWRELARVAPISEVLETVLAESDLAFYQAGLPDGAAHEQNWRKIIETVRAREADEQGGLRALIDDFTALIEEAENGDKEAEAPLPGQASIQLMTVWAAKGLGFPMTVLAQLDGKPSAKPVPLLRGNLDGTKQMAFGLSDDADEEKLPKPWVWEKLRAIDNAEEDAQWRRLFYVAVTRAESHLLLVRPENAVGAAVAWINLCQDAHDQLRPLMPVDGIPETRAAPLKSEMVAPPDAPAPPLLRANPREIALIEVAGPPAERFGSRARTWLENQLDTLGGAAENARQDVPFSSPAAIFGIENGEWLVGAWEWLAPLPDGSALLVASGETESIAAARAHLMLLAARDVGFEVRGCWALWLVGEQTEGKLI